MASKAEAEAEHAASEAQRRISAEIEVHALQQRLIELQRQLARAEGEAEQVASLQVC